MAQKTSDYSVIPLCHLHHQTHPQSYHRLTEPQFQATWKLNLANLTAHLNSQYQGQTGSTPQPSYSGAITRETIRTNT